MTKKRPVKKPRRGTKRYRIILTAKQRKELQRLLTGRMPRFIDTIGSLLQLVDEAPVVTTEVEALDELEVEIAESLEWLKEV